MSQPSYQKTVIIVCFGTAILCVLALFPLTAHVISLPREAMGTQAYERQWLLACSLGIVGLVSAITGQRLSKKTEQR